MRYHKPISISFLTVGAIMLMTLSVLYWNYHENIHRRMTKKHGLVLDHWGKGAPTELETRLLAGEVPEVLQGGSAAGNRLTSLSDDMLLLTTPGPSETNTDQVLGGFFKTVDQASKGR